MAKARTKKPAKRTAKTKAKPAAAGFDPAAPILSGTSAAGVEIWQPISEVLAFAKPNKTRKLMTMIAYEFDDGITLWATAGLITQIGLRAGYRGVIEGIGVGAPLTALEVLGDLGTDDDGNIVVDGLAGVVFDGDATTLRGIYVTALGENDDGEP